MAAIVSHPTWSLRRPAPVLQVSRPMNAEWPATLGEEPVNRSPPWAARAPVLRAAAAASGRGRSRSRSRGALQCLAVDDDDDDDEHVDDDGNDPRLNEWYRNVSRAAPVLMTAHPHATPVKMATLRTVRLSGKLQS